MRAEGVASDVPSWSSSLKVVLAKLACPSTASADAFRRLGLGPFVYDKAGKKMAMSYDQAPESILDDPVEARAWAVLAFEAALRVKKPPQDTKAKERG